MLGTQSLGDEETSLDGGPDILTGRGRWSCGVFIAPYAFSDLFAAR